ncbi:MAG: class I SAM-dependent methyltransferase [Actinobacteria bacterium]|nr:class I SAM-dependent methyltransferase [Actinomycetota bacterium]
MADASRPRACGPTPGRRGDEARSGVSGFQPRPPQHHGNTPARGAHAGRSRGRAPERCGTCGQRRRRDVAPRSESRSSEVRDRRRYAPHAGRLYRRAHCFGREGPWNDAAGRALVAWLKQQHPQFAPRCIVDLGCGLGHNTLPLREAFPQAEIVAVDVAAPMLRYGHARARARGFDDVQFLQADATATPLADNSADLVFTTMVLHETSRQALPKIFAEAHRLLRAGGLTIHLEQPPYRGLPAFEQFMRDWDGRFNNEPFWSALHETDCAALLAKSGFGSANVFESRCTAPPAGGSTRGDEQHEDFGRAPAWYAVGAWQVAKGLAANG